MTVFLECDDVMLTHMHTHAQETEDYMGCVAVSRCLSPWKLAVITACACTGWDMHLCNIGHTPCEACDGLEQMSNCHSTQIKTSCVKKKCCRLCPAVIKLNK